nr:hypothetical protein CFP56_18255 [Quercus suber]
MLWKPNLKSYRLISFTKIENSAKKLGLSSSVAKGKGRFLEEKSERQREDPNSPPHVKSEGQDLNILPFQFRQGVVFSADHAGGHLLAL